MTELYPWDKGRGECMFCNYFLGSGGQEKCGGIIWGRWCIQKTENQT